MIPACKYIIFEYFQKLRFFSCTHQALAEVSKKKAYDNLELVQNEGRNSSHEHKVIAEDMGNSYREGSSSVPQFPSQPTRFHGQHLVHSNFLLK